MDDAHIRTLNKYNQVFYDRFGTSFARQREYFWPSWYEFAAGSRRADSQTPQVVTDIGCGSGRFALFWENELDASLAAYHGVDASAPLLQVAREQLKDLRAPVSLHEQDIVEAILDGSFSPPKSDVFVLFGVLHHIPNQEVRCRLLQILETSLSEHGEIWCTLWNPERVGGKKMAVKEQLDESTALLGWQHESDALRYVHWISPEEEDELIGSLSHTKVLRRWEQNEPGERGNICFILQA